MSRLREVDALIRETSPQTPAVFLDRDGTIIVDKHYACDPDGIELIDGAVDGLGQLQDAGFRLFVITNQSGVARGYFREDDVRAMHRRLDLLLRRHGVRIERFLHCPHHPHGTVADYAFPCVCRKPNPGPIWQANVDQSIDLRRSWVIGDAPGDVLAGVRAGCKTILLEGRRWRELAFDVPVDHYASDLREAAAIIVRQMRPVLTLVHSRG